MTKPAKTNHHEPAALTAPVTWRQVQEATKKRDRALAELNGVIARYGLAEAELTLATDRLDRAMAIAAKEPDAGKPGARE